MKISFPKCKRCGFIYFRCQCHQIPRKRFKELKEKIYNYILRKQILYQLARERLKSKIRMRKHILRCKLKRIVVRIPRNDKIGIYVSVEKMKEIIGFFSLSEKNSAFLKDLIIKADTADTSRKAKKDFKKFKIEYMMEIHEKNNFAINNIKERQEPFRIDPNTLLLMKGIQEIKICKSNIPIIKSKKRGKIA